MAALDLYYELAALGCLLVLLLAATKWYERNAMFAPTMEHALTPAEAGLPPPQEIFLDSGGAKIHSWFFAGNPTATTILYIHGNGGNVADRLPVIRGYLDLGLGTFIYDPRGYGKSGGRATRENFVEDAFRAYRYLVDERGIEPSSIVILGQSLGGAAALLLANEATCKGLILEGAFVSIREVAKDIYPNLPVFLLASTYWDNEREIRKIRVPVLLMCGSLDETINPRHTRRLFDAAHEPRELVVIDGAGHADMCLHAPEVYYGAIARLAK